MNATISATSIPSIDRPGVASRFPKVANYVKNYTMTLVYANWNSKQIPALELYAAGKAGKTLRHDGKVTVEFHKASFNLLMCSRALQWHAVQAALGNTKPYVLGVSRSVAPAATLKAFGKLITNGKHVHMGTPPAMLANYFKTEPDDPDYDPKIAEQFDQNISAAEFKIVCHLLLEGHAPESVEAALENSAPMLAMRKGNEADLYVKDTVSRALADEKLKTWTDERIAAQKDAQALADSGTSWLVFWRRSVAYAYWSCRMSWHSGDLENWILELANTAGCCLALGWADAAMTLFRQMAEGIERGVFADFDNKKTKPFFQRRTQFFLLRMVAQWQSIPLPVLPPQADDEPLFCALLAHWRTSDPAVLEPLLLALCDRHTHLVLLSKDSPDFGAFGDLTYIPFEVLAILRVRDILGLSNPVLDHPLMNTALGKLPPVSELYGDSLLDSVVRQARTEFSEI